MSFFSESKFVVVTIFWYTQVSCMNKAVVTTTTKKTIPSVSVKSWCCCSCMLHQSICVMFLYVCLYSATFRIRTLLQTHRITSHHNIHIQQHKPSNVNTSIEIEFKKTRLRLSLSTHKSTHTMLSIQLVFCVTLSLYCQIN